MYGGGDHRPMSVDTEPSTPLPINSRALIVSDSSALKHVSQSSPFPRVETQNGNHSQQSESIVNHSKSLKENNDVSFGQVLQKLQDDLQEMGRKIKHHEDNVKYLKNLKNRLDESILDLQVAAGKYHTTSSPCGDGSLAYLESEEETVQHILNYEKSAAALVCRMKIKLEAQISDHPLVKDVLGVVATLGKVDDTNLSRLLSEYLGLNTMLAIVCKTYEGVKALEAYNKDGSINKDLGIHAFAARIGMGLDERFNVICLEHLRSYAGDLIADDPQKRLDLIKPRLINGEAPPGFLGFAVNMITIDNANLYGLSKTGYNLRQTLFYNLFSNLQVYSNREDMLKSLSCITNGAISLDGGVVRSTGFFSLGHLCGDINVKFPYDSKGFKPHEGFIEMEKRMKETKWKKGRALEDLQREESLLDHARFNYETKKREFLQFLAESSSYAPQP